MLAEPGFFLVASRPEKLASEARNVITSRGTGHWGCELNLLAYGKGNRGSERGRGQRKATQPGVVLVFCFSLWLVKESFGSGGSSPR